MLEYEVTYFRGDGKEAVAYYPYTIEGQKRAEAKAETMDGKISMVETDPDITC